MRRLIATAIFLAGTQFSSVHAQTYYPLTGQWWGLLPHGYLTAYLSLSEGVPDNDGRIPIKGRIWVTGGQSASLTGEFREGKLNFEYVNGVGSFHMNGGVLDGSFTFRQNVYPTAFKKKE